MLSGIEPATACEWAHGLPLDHSVTPQKKVVRKYLKKYLFDAVFHAEYDGRLSFPTKETKILRKKGKLQNLTL